MSIQGQRAAANAAKAAGENERMAARWNAEQSEKQARREEEIAQRNMRRERENNKRQLARQRAMGARSGLAETGAVAASLIDAAERMDTEIDDIWEAAATRAQTLRAEANMQRWEGEQAYEAGKLTKKNSKYDIYGTALQGLSSVASAGMQMKGALNTGAPMPNPNQTAPLKAVPYRG